MLVFSNWANIPHQLVWYYSVLAEVILINIAVDEINKCCCGKQSWSWCW